MSKDEYGKFYFLDGRMKSRPREREGSQDEQRRIRCSNRGALLSKRRAKERASRDPR